MKYWNISQNIDPLGIRSVKNIEYFWEFSQSKLPKESAFEEEKGVEVDIQQIK